MRARSSLPKGSGWKPANYIYAFGENFLCRGRLWDGGLCKVVPCWSPPTLWRHGRRSSFRKGGVVHFFLLWKDYCPPAMRPPSDEHRERGGGFHKAGNTSQQKKRKWNDFSGNLLNFLSELKRIPPKIRLWSWQDSRGKQKAKRKNRKRKTPISTYFACEKRG